VKAFIELERARCSARTAFMRAEDLFVIFRSMAPQKDWKWLAGIVGRMRGGLEGEELKPRLGIEAKDIYAWALKRMAHIPDVDGLTELRRAAVFRDGLMVGLLIATALRLRTFIAIDVEKHLIRSAEGFGLKFKPEDMKDKRAHEFILPDELTDPMRMYLADFRPKLLGGKASSRLWITHHGEACTYGGFQRQLPQLTQQVFGIALRPHAFRSIVATSIATDDPEHASIIADVLRHATLAMSHKHYVRATGVKAMSDLQQVVAELRRDGKLRQREKRRITDSGARLPDALADASLWGEAAEQDIS
jgi:integrase